MNTDRMRVLLLEDNVDHAMLIQTSLAEHSVEVVHLPSAETAQSYLDGQPAPIGVMLVDVSLPGQSGVEFLRWVKQSKVHVVTPVVMLSTSDNPKDIRQSFQWGASGYITKPVGLQELKTKLNVFMEYWINTSLLPNCASD
ncbi:response regulator [Simiduia aestuariiviva]|uniref:DNA-binding response OmpR family regulator n=1 Tax=Simiduia aestuariiviva TaxID=1510459 RepID=A0A839UHU6_9GAMM|nr:response regulator [Simiduia aestuariiviva]MBB3167053.1 DNA-binding response OmpR family regulator [Simiduia aestuariiviva]